MATSLVDCELAGRCSGCPWILRPGEEQRSAKAEQVRTLWLAQGLAALPAGEPFMKEIAPAGLRDRVDLVIERYGDEYRVGLYDVDRKEVLTLGTCPQMSRGLREWFHDFRADPPPIERGSVRLRISPDGGWGAWLDFANVDVKRLLDEGAWLRRLFERAVVEIGQKRKRLVEKQGKLALGAPELSSWMDTVVDGKEQPLYSAVGTFTQVGQVANRALVAELLALLPPEQGRWVELGAGIGNFTLPLAARVGEVLAIENDPLAGEGLEKSAAEAGLGDRIRWQAASFQQKDPRMGDWLRGAAGVLADPPRSGLGAFTDELAALAPQERPRHFVYVSCYAESFVADAAKLEAMGYQLVRIVGVDQFPQTAHGEFLARFTR